MAEAMEGIMGLPNAPMGGQSGQSMSSMVDMQALEQASAEANKDPMAFRESVLSGMEEADPQLVAEFKRELTGMQLPDDVIQALGQMVDEILRSPQDYQEIRQEMVTDDVEGIFADLLPETFDMAYFMALDMALDQIAMNTAQGPQAFADGGLATLKPIAAAMAQMGRNGDTILAHITPAEARMLRARGGSGTINPYTGLPEYFGFVKKAFKAVKKAVKRVAKVVKKTVDRVKSVVKKVASSTIGRIALTIGATMLLGPAGLNFAGSIGLGSGALAYGVNAAAASTLVGVAGGQSFGDALKGGIVSGVMAGGMAAVFPSTLPDAYTAQAAQNAAGATGAALPGVDDFTVKSAGAGGTDAAATGTGLTTPTSVADVTVGTPVPEVYMPSDVSAMTPAPIPSMGAQPVWDPNLGEMTLGGIPASQITAGAPTAVAPMGAYNMPASFANPIQAPASTLGGGFSVADQYGTALSRGPVTGVPSVTSPSSLSGAATQAGADASQQGVMSLLKQNDYLGAAKQAGSNVVDFFMPQDVSPGSVTYNTKYAELAKAYPDATSTALHEMTSKAMPGVVQRYAPLALAGVGTAAAMGAFTPPEEPSLSDLGPEFSGPSGSELLAQQPERYGVTIGETKPSYVDVGQTVYSPMGYNPQQRQYYDFRNAIAYMPGYRPQQPFYASYMPQSSQGSYYQMPTAMADGGIATLKRGGSPKKFPRKNGHISGPGGPKDDKIPAMLSDGEFVFTAKAVRGMGNGSRRKGAKKMYAMMKALERRTA